MIAFSCPHCSQKLNLKDESAGKRGKCPKCQGVVLVPMESGAVATVPTGDGSLNRLSAVSVNAAAPGDSRVANPVAEYDATIVQPSKNLVPPDENAATIKQATDTRPQLSSPVSPARMPETFGRYKIRRELGRGAMGAVYLALDTNLDREVALKVPQFGPDTSGEEIARFYREARAMATVHHPNLCSVHDVGSESGVHYLTMAFIKGRPLSECIKSEAPLEARRVAGLVAKLAAALDEAHQAGIVHRDLKPANIMLDQRQEPIIMDFGLARRNRENERELTQTGQLMGTPMYMAPEQVEGEHAKIGPATDVYALGVIMYQMLCGRPPFDGALGTMLSKIVTQPPPRPTAILAAVDPELEAICLKAMAKQPADRFASAGELAKTLHGYLEKTLTDSMIASLDPRAKANPAAASPSAVTSNMDATGTWLPSVSSAGKAQPVAAAASEAKPERLRQPPRKLIAAGLAGVLLLFGVIVIVRNKAGQEVARIEVPDGETVDVKRTDEKRPTDPKPPDGGPYGTALKFDGDDVVDIPSLKFDTQSSYTLEGFITSPEKADKGAGLVFGMPLQSYLSFTKASDWRWVYFPHKRTAGVEIAIAGAPARPARTHVACVRDGKLNRLFVDGKVYHKVAEVTSVAEGTSPFQIGVEFRGIVDELRVSKVARYTSNFAPPARFEPDADTLALYHFDEGQGDQLLDSSGNKHHGQIRGATWVTADGTAIASVPAKPASQSIPAAALTLNGHRYLLLETPGTWDEAKARAEAMGGHLVTFNSKAELSWVRYHFWLNRQNAKDADLCFLGGRINEKRTEGTWVTGEPFDMSLWDGERTSGDLGRVIVMTAPHGHWDVWRGKSKGTTSHFLVEWDPRWPLAPSKPEDIQHWLDAKVEVTVRTAAPGGGSGIDTKLTTASLPADPATIIGVKFGNDSVDDAQIDRLIELTDLEQLDFGPKTSCSPEGLRKLGSLVQLRWISLYSVNKKAAGLSDLLKSWPNLEYLHLPAGKPTADEWLAAAVTRPSITHVNAYRADINDNSLLLLEKMSQLQLLTLHDNAQITEAAIQRFAAAMPRCRIVYGGYDRSRQKVIEPRTSPLASTPLDDK